MRLIVIAKAPRPGFSKTRLSPPCTPEQAAALAEAALRDTLAAVAAAPAEERILALDGEPGAWLDGGGFGVIAQRGGGLEERLAAAFDDAGGPALLVGMDTPQLTPPLLVEAWDALMAPAVDAVLGAAGDGGYWAIGLRKADPRVFDSIPMSVDHTCRAQRERLVELGLRHVELPELLDVDTIDDARLVAAQAPGSRFAAALAAAGIEAR